MAQVPASYIKDKAVDFEAEIFACAGVSRTFCGVEVNPPSVGVLALLEVLNNQFIGAPADATVRDFTEALYVAKRRELAAPAVQEWALTREEGPVFEVAKPATWTPWDRMVMDFWAEISPVFEPKVMSEFSTFMMGVTFDGYEMLPPSPSNAKFIFGAEAIAGCVLRGGRNVFEAVWRMPLCLSGHMAAIEARSNGVKGVSRPKDPTDVRDQLKAAAEREAKGELHPWQIAEPDFYALEPAQAKARPEAKKEFNALLKACLRKKREGKST